MNFVKNFESTSYSQADKMALDITGTEVAGRWLEIGAMKPIQYSNTALLEHFGWSGISLELSPRFKQHWEQSTRDLSNFYFADAITFPYKDIVDKHFNFLQLDIDPAPNTFKCLENVMAAGISADFITFEHDKYRALSHLKFKEDAFDMLRAKGYRRIFEDVPPSDRPKMHHEDWYIGENIDKPFKGKIQWHDWAESRLNKYCKYGFPLVRG